MRALTRRTSAVCVMFVTAMAACADDGPGEDPNAMASPVDTAFTEGVFDDIPVFRGATPIQGPSRQDGTVTATYETQGGSPETALRYYEENLAELGWEVADPVRETSDSVWRGDWIRDGRRLQVSALPFTAGDDEFGPHTQFSLVLLDDTGDIPVGGSVPP